MKTGNLYKKAVMLTESLIHIQVSSKALQVSPPQQAK